MKTSNNGTDISHNVQISVDNKADLVVAIDVTSNPADQGQLSNMAIKSKEELKVAELTVLADKGYWNGEELKKCEENNITTIVSSPEEHGTIGYKKSDFKYNKEKDYYVCPMGKILPRTGNKEKRYKNTKVCKECPNRNKCTKNKTGKSLVVGQNEEYLERAKQRQKENMELYKQRQMIVEHVFGTIKRNLGYTYLLLRGNEKVKGESFMHFLIYNIKRVCNIKKTKDIIEAIKAKEKEKTAKNIVVKIFFSNFFEERGAVGSDPYN
ncbi:MAG: transposase [Clostridia bacterium]|nr:transposase [Clostridia bacterium]